MEYLSFFKQVVSLCHLSALWGEPKRVTGGLLHKMFRVDTENQSYAIKLLNPNVMKRLDAIDNYNKADELEEIIRLKGIPIVSSLVINNHKRQVLNGQHYYIYPWYEGKSCTTQQITKSHCIKISQTLFLLHQIETRFKVGQHPVVDMHWDYYLNRARMQNKVITDLMKENFELLEELVRKANLSFSKIGHVETLCHNDLDSKNVLWKENEFKIIDCECLSYGNPYLELFEVALSWSGLEQNKIDFELFETIISTYFQKTGLVKLDFESIFYSNVNRIEWLEYNLKRALEIECDSEDEMKLGIEQVEITLKQIQTIHQNCQVLLAILKKYMNP